MNKLVTIAIPVYKRLNTLPNALQSVASQDYPNIELIVSDNGENGDKVYEIVKQWYPRLFRFRQNQSTVNISIHYNQLLEEANGDYFVALDDDDSISPDFSSELIHIIEKNPSVVVAFAKQNIVDNDGKILRQSSENVPTILKGREFIPKWNFYSYENYSTMFAKTSKALECGGFPNFPKGTHIDDALLLKLCLNGDIAFCTRCWTNWRLNETSYGWSMECLQLAKDTRQFLKFLDNDTVIRHFALREPKQWNKLKSYIVEMTWSTYLYRWDNIYKERLKLHEWIKAAFALPFIPKYYWSLQGALRRRVVKGIISSAKRLLVY